MNLETQQHDLTQQKTTSSRIPIDAAKTLTGHKTLRSRIMTDVQTNNSIKYILT